MLITHSSVVVDPALHIVLPHNEPGKLLEDNWSHSILSSHKSGPFLSCPLHTLCLTAFLYL